MELLMINMILVLALSNLVQLIRARLFNLKSNVLSCGITAYCGEVPADPNIIRMIMMYNQERGDDGTGWAVNNVVTKSTDKVRDFLTKNTLIINQTDENYTILAHARKASVGSRLNKELVHPFAMYKDGIENKKPDLILGMNGTLDNTQLMADHFKVDYQSGTNSDTQILARIMTKLGSKEYMRALESYGGTATLVFFTPTSPNTLMIYKDPERPLFIWQKDKNQAYISSMEEALKGVGAKDEDISTFDDKHLYRINKGKITKKEPIERNPLKPRAVYKKQTTYHGGGAQCRMYERDAYYEAMRENGDSLEIMSNINKNSHTGKGNLVYVLCDKYYRNGHLLNGKWKIDLKGNVPEASSNEPGEKNHFFVWGHLCASEEKYNELVEKLGDKDKKEISLQKFKQTRLGEIIEFFMYPCIVIANKKEQWILNDKYSNLLKGISSEITLNMFLCPCTYTLKYNGEWTSTTQKDLCILTKINEKAELSVIKSNNRLIADLSKKIPEDSQREFLRGMIISSPDGNSQKYLSMMRTDLYKVNPGPEIREHFYNLVLRLLLDEGVLKNEQYNDIKDLATRNTYGSSLFTEKVDLLLKEFIKKQSKKKNVEKLEGLSSSEKVKEFDKIHNEFSIEDIIESIKDSNSLYAADSFKNDIADVKIKEIDEVVRQYGSVNEDVKVHEAILLCLNDVGVVQNDELIRWEEKDEKSKIEEVEQKFKDWVNFWEKKAGEDNEDEIVIGITPEEFEGECYTEVQRVLDDIIAARDRMNKAEDELKTEGVKKCITELDSQIRFLKKQFSKEKVM